LLFATALTSIVSVLAGSHRTSRRAGIVCPYAAAPIAAAVAEDVNRGTDGNTEAALPPTGFIGAIAPKLASETLRTFRQSGIERWQHFVVIRPIAPHTREITGAGTRPPVNQDRIPPHLDISGDSLVHARSIGDINVPSLRSRSLSSLPLSALSG
jgi:hypothetical protein